MADPIRMPTAPAPTATPWEFVTAFLGVLAALGGLFLLDVALARIDRKESVSHAVSLYDEGKTLLAHGDAHTATERFASAFAMDRSNRDYELALAEGLLADGRVDEAEATLTTLLARAETDGAVNIAMARVLVREGRVEEAKSFYHRAIYGRWRDDATTHREQSRFELIDLLARRHDERELLAELLPMQDVAPESLALRRRIGHLFVAAGSPSRGIQIFRDLLRRNGSDADAYAGLGEAALVLGNFHTARADLSEAHRLAPAMPRVADLLAITDTIVALNPEERGVSAHERFERSRAVLARTLAVLERCDGLPASPIDTTRTGNARQLLARSVRRSMEESSRDAILNEASALWSGRPPGCEADSTVAGQALARIQARLAQ